MDMASEALLGQRKRTVLNAIGVAGLVLLLAAGFAFTSTMSVARVTDNARALHWVNATVGTSALVRAGLVQTTTFSELAPLGLATLDDVEFSMSQVADAVRDLRHLADTGAGMRSRPHLVRFDDLADQVIAALRTDNPTEAKELIRTELEGAYQDLHAELEAEQLEIAVAIEANSASGQALNTWVVFILTLAVPASAIAVYFVIARRQVRASRERSELELETERAIGRAKDEFIAGLSHELRTPLTSIFGYASIQADRGIQGAEAVQETGQIIANEAAEMTRMVDDLLIACRLTSTGVEVDLEPTAIDGVVRSAVGQFERTGSSIQWEPSNMWATADADRLRHVLVNLLSNAVRHGGPAVGVNVTATDDTVEIEVWDNGPGLPPDKEATLFQRYVNRGTEPLLTGSVGLGLGVAALLTSLMGGELRYQRFGSRTYFVVGLERPVVDEGSAEADDVAAMIRTLSA